MLVFEYKMHMHEFTFNFPSNEIELSDIKAMNRKFTWHRNVTEI